MNNIQLFALKQGGTSPASYLQLDLYPEEPIKITKSVEAIENPQATTSAFSRTFRIPATSVNGDFMKAVFNVNSTDYDATQKADAYINLNGAYFISGNIRLQNIFKNSKLGKIEYEIIFMGETSNFASKVGPKNLSELDLTNPATGQNLVHFRNYTNIVASWSKTLFGGAVVYPLCEWGYDYTGGVPDQSTLAVYSSATVNPKGFTNSANPLEVSQFKPFIQAKYLWDRIFDGAGFTYSSNFLNSQLFKNIYTVMTNKDTSGAELSSTLSFRVAMDPNQKFPNVSVFGGVSIRATFVYSDISNSYTTTNPGFFTAPYTGLYNFEITGMFANYTAISAGSPKTFTISVQATGKAAINKTAYVNNIGGSADKTKVYSDPGLTNTTITFVGVQMDKGDILALRFDSFSFFARFEILKGTFSGEIPNIIDPKGLLPSQYKQLDFIKAINDRFKLIWEPDPQNPSKFIIEPWKDWVKLGTKKDWSDKIDENMDETVTPAFYTQPRQWNFLDAEEADLYNFSYQQENKQTFGQLNENSNIEIISGVKEITSLFAAYPVAPIPGNDLFLLPHLAKDTEAQRQPIQVKPRLCFFNNANVIDAPVDWYLRNDAGVSTLQTTYPITSSFDRFPFTSTAFDLSWTNVRQFWVGNTTTGAGRTNITAYNAYWATWFDSIFNPFSRIMTATFAIDSNDFRTLRFNDKIFIRDAWWFPLKIYDFVLGEETAVKVDLLKIGSIGVSLEDTEPTILFEHPLLCFHPTDPCIACCCQGLVLVTLWTTTPSFLGATNYYSDPAGSVAAQSGYYNDGTNTIFIDSDGVALASYDCSTCDCDQSGLTEINACYGDTQCEACCCLIGGSTIYTDGPTIGTSSRAWADATGTTPLVPNRWYAFGGEVMLIGADGVTIILLGTCSACDCTPLQQLAPLPGFYFPTNGFQACCIQGPTVFLGTDTYWSESSTFFPATGFYTDNSTSFPLAATAAGFTGPVWLSDGQFYKDITNGVVTATLPCPPITPGNCPGRVNSVLFNLINSSGIDTVIDATYTISYDGVNYFYTGSTGASGIGFSALQNIYYDPNSFMRAEIDVSFGTPPTPGNLNVLLTVDGVTAFNTSVPTPTTYITPPYLAGTGSNQWIFTWTP
jgi:hypothetical protein